MDEIFQRWNPHQCSRSKLSAQGQREPELPFGPGHQEPCVRVRESAVFVQQATDVICVCMRDENSVNLVRRVACFANLRWQPARARSERPGTCVNQDPVSAVIEKHCRIRNGDLVWEVAKDSS